MRLSIPILGGAGVLAAATLLSPNAGRASSHREAPFIAKMPAVDGTDFYAFNSYETGRTGYVTLIANYLPLQDAYGGPNYFSLDPDALYEIHIDNTGDGVEDITYQFQFSSALKNGTGVTLSVGGKNVAVPVVVAAPGIVDHDNEAARNQVDSYKINVVTNGRRSGTPQPIVNHGPGNSPTFTKPLDNIGTKTIPNYNTYANSFIYQIDIPGCTPPDGTFPKVFVGQRQEGFPVNLGEIFDTVNVGVADGGAVANVIGAEDQGKNIVANKNVTTIALEIPASCLVSATGPTIGAWTTASVRQARVINPTPTFTDPSKIGGPWVQVSRLGMPLVNEVVIGLPDKNKFNSSEPKDDVANFADYVTNPTLPAILELLFGSVPVTAPTRFPRTDLLTAFALGIPGVNQIKENPTPAEMLRLNTTTTGALAPKPATAQSPFGAALCFSGKTATDDPHPDLTAPGCDPTGFPNGRRPGDDVVDVELRVAMGALLNTTDAKSGNQAFVDGATFGTVTAGHTMAQNFQSTFPYLNAPIPGAPTP